MIIIRSSIWRAECIAALDLDDEVIFVYPVNCNDYVQYFYEDDKLAAKAFEGIVAQWKKELADQNTKS